MSEEEKFSVDTEQLKNETKETVNQVKDSIKNVNLKEEAKEAKGFFKKMISNPFETVNQIATGKIDILRKAIIIMILFIAGSLILKITHLVNYNFYGGIGKNIKGIIISIVRPIFYIIVPAITILILNKQNKKSLTTIISTLVITSIPTIINIYIYIIENIIRKITIITNPITSVFKIISIILTYFGIKELFEIKDNNNFIKKYIIVQIIIEAIFTILIQIGIY